LEGDLRDERIRALHERREAARRERGRRRRLLAVGALIALVAAALVAVVLASSGSDGDSGKQGKAGKPAGGGPKGESAPKPVSHAGWKPHPGPVPFLMYHVIGDPKPGAPFPELFVSEADFRKQMDYLDKQGYQAVTQAAIEHAWDKGTPVPPKPIVLTFDDGYLGQFTDALPILKSHGWPGVLNLKAEGSDLNTGEVKKMIAAGWELASHTISHLDLTKATPQQLTREVAEPRQLLRRRFHIPVTDFCYPAGRYDAQAVAAVKRAGYRGATTVDPGLAKKNEPYTLKRIRINRSSGLPGFITALRSAGASTASVTGGG
jgi:peptidoglycan/xylan/chitin deacetylase (PgdA/CDA1 family)